MKFYYSINSILFKERVMMAITSEDDLIHLSE
jgi:hypothetical protein